VYTEVLVSNQNCDSTVITTVSVNPSFEMFISETICEAEQFIFGTQILSQAGIYTELFKTVQDCDSLVTLDLSVLPSFINVDAQGDKTIRLGEQTPIRATFASIDSLEAFQWTSSDSTSLICDTCLFQLVAPSQTTTGRSIL